VVIAAGGRADAPIALGDTLVAFALPLAGDPGPGLVSRLIDWPGGRFAASAVAAAVLLVVVAWAFFAWRRRRTGRGK
jgi:quinoprotein glucose dehydrogenase